MSPTQSKFSPANQTQWTNLVDNVLKGMPIDSLTRRDEDGLEIKALYDVLPVKSASDLAVSAARLPVDPQRYIAHGWDICQPVDGGLDPQTCNRLILDELEDGAGSLWLAGLTADVDMALAARMQDVVLNAAGVCLDSGNNVLAHLVGFANLARQRGCALAEMRFGANIDPFAPEADTALLANGLSYLGSAAAEDLPPRLFGIGGWHWHNRGMTTVQELAYILAGLTAVLRRANHQAIDFASLLPRLSATLALPADLFDGVVKCRALRQCWAGILAPLGFDAAQHRLFIHGATSLRMFATLDIEVNMLRTTTALLGGAIGGVDQMSAFAHDCLAGSSADGRRLARMQQHLLIEESGLSRSLDPAGGAGFIEERTHDLARAVWAAFQKIEADGGAEAMQADGRFAAWARASAAQRFDRFACGNLQLVGVNLQPENRHFPPVLHQWRGLRRPSAAIEAIRQAAFDNPPRILVLHNNKDAGSIPAGLSRLLAMGRMAPVLMRAADADANTFATASPDHVILLDCDLSGLADEVAAALSPLAAAGGLHLATDILGEAQPLFRLASFAGVSLDDYITGDA